MHKKRGILLAQKALSFIVSSIVCVQTLTVLPNKGYAAEVASDTTETKQIFYGDVNEDGKISVNDAVMIEKYVLTSNADLLRTPEAADVDVDGKVTLRDAEIIFQFDSGIIKYPADYKPSEILQGLKYYPDVKWTFYPDPAKYEIINTGLSWQEAEAYCESKGGHLAVITSEREQAMIKSLVNEAPETSGYFIGGYRNENGEFKWVTDEPMTYTNWNQGEPSSNDENSIELYYNGSWNDLHDHSKLAFICEWEEPKKDSLPSTTTSVTTTTSSPDTTTYTAKETLTTATAISDPQKSGVKDTELSDSSKYIVVKNEMTWDEANDYCTDVLKGHLVTINSAEEQELVENLIKGNNERINYWLGGSCGNDRVFHWVTGAPLTYTNWLEGQPYGAKNNCIEMYSFSDEIVNSAHGKWSINRNYAKRYFICEYDDVQDTQTTSATTTASTTTTSTTSKATDMTTTSSSATTESNTDITTYTTVTTVTATLITDITKEQFSAVTTVYDPQIEKSINEKKNERLKINGELTAKPMTLDEIKEAGIDVYDYENYHYFKYSVELTFRDEPIIFTKYEVVPISNDETPGEDSTPTPGPMVTYHGEKKKVLEAPVNIPEYEISISSYEYEDQEMFIIIYGEDKWLKEFYDVQLIVMNTDKETLEDCSATINVPDGLTLCNSEQTQYVGDLLPYSVRDVHWYLRGDAAGDYSISALFKGKNDGDTFSYSFTTKEDVHVYAGDALKLTIAVPGYSCYKYGYPIKITMTNTSDKPIYNLQHKADVKHGYYSYTHIHNNGTSTIIKSSVPLGGATKTIDVNELLPGESAVIDLKISDMWKSPLQKRLENSKLFIDAISLGLKSTLGGFIASFASKFIDGITVIHVLDGTVVTTLKGSTTEVPYELIVTDNLDEIGKDKTFSLTEAIVSSAIDQGPKGLKTFYYENLTFTNAFEFVSGIKNAMEEDWKRVENNEITVEQFQEKYNQEYLDYIFGNLGNVFNIVGWDCAAILEVENDIYKILSVPADFSGGTAYVTDKDGNIIQKNDSLLRNPKPGNIRKVGTSEEPDFEFEFLTGDFEYKNGIYSFTEDSLIRIKANKPGEKYTVHFVDDDGNEEQFTFITVPEHECTGDKYYVVSAPDSEGDGIAMQFCEVCGKPLDSKHIPASFCAMLSDGQMFQNVYQAAEYAEENYKEAELSLLGDITLDKDLVIPDNVKLLITPFANITLNNSSHIFVDGNYIDFTKTMNEYISDDKSLLNNSNETTTTNISTVSSTTTSAITTAKTTTTAAATADKRIVGSWYVFHVNIKTDSYDFTDDKGVVTFNNDFTVEAKSKITMDSDGKLHENDGYWTKNGTWSIKGDKYYATPSGIQETEFIYDAASDTISVSLTDAYLVMKRGGKITSPINLGDINNDGKVNAVDASTVLTYYANISTNKDGGFTESQKKAADVDNNGDINAVDASYILSYYAYTSTTKEDIMSIEEYMKKK